jgi:hypothetical protein
MSKRIPPRPRTTTKQAVAAAARLRSSPGEAATTRIALEAAIRPPLATTGKALVDLLRSSPLGGVELELTRDCTPARPAKFGA